MDLELIGASFVVGHQLALSKVLGILSQLTYLVAKSSAIWFFEFLDGLWGSEKQA